MSRIEKRTALSSAQRRLYLQCQRPGGDRAYHLLYLARVRGPLSVAAAEAFAARMLGRHEALRTGFRMEDGQLVAEVHTDCRVPVAVENADEDGLGDVAERYDAPFDLAAPPLVRVGVVRFGRDDCVVVVNVHHLVFDGTSAAIVARDLGDALAGRLVETPVARTYADFVASEVAWFDSLKYTRARAFWCSRYERAPARLALAPDFTPPATRNFEGASFTRYVKAAPVRGSCASRECTLFTFLLTAFCATLHRLTGQHEITVGTLFSQRDRGHFQDVVGLFANTLPLTVAVEAGASFSTLLDSVSATLQASLEHADFPFEHLVTALPFVERGARNPLFDVVFNFERAGGRRVETFGDVTVEPVDCYARVSQFDFSIDVVEYVDEIRFRVEYSTALYREDTLLGLMDAYVAILEQACGDVHARIQALSLLSDEVRGRLLAWNDTARALPAGRTVMDAWRRAAAEHGDNPAVRHRGREVTYSQLETRATRLAGRLRGAGLRPGDVVAVALERSPDLIVALLAIWKTGLVYLPLSPALPALRRQHCLADSGSALVITRESWREMFKDVLIVDAPGDGPLEPPYSVSPQQTAYVLYTSGSTGTPKGVLVDHRALHAHVEAMRPVYRLRPDDNVLQLSSVMFDASLEQIVMTLTAGACLVLPDVMDPDAVSRLLSVEEITVAEFPPAYLETLLPHLTPRTVATLRCVMSGGDVLSPSLAKRVKRLLPSGARLLNVYGPTEATMAATVYTVPPDLDRFASWASLPIGRPLQNTRTYVVRDGAALPVGVTGELCIAGERLAQGYLNQPALTAQRFIDLEILDGRERVYCTGDRVRLLADGDLEFLGRLDRQVQLRGYRVELGEIEHALQQHEAVLEAVAGVEDGRLGAFVRTEGGIDAAALREWLGALLPDYMIPDLVMVDEIPQDRSFVGCVVAARKVAPPLDSVEWEVWGLWRDLLKAPQVGRDDGFYRLGGNSLHALHLMAEVRNRWGVDLPLAVVMGDLTVASLARLLREGASPTAHSRVVPLRGGGGPVVVLVPGLGGNLLDLHDLFTALDAYVTCYGLQHAWGVDDADERIEVVAARLVDELESQVGLEGGILVGHSFGAYLALAMAIALEQRGRGVAAIVALDVAAPGESDYRPTERELLELTVRTLLGEDAPALPAQGEYEAALALLKAANRLPDIQCEQLRSQIESLGRRAAAFSRYAPDSAVRADVRLVRARELGPASDFAREDGGWPSRTRGHFSLTWAEGSHFTMIKAPAVCVHPDGLAISLAQMLRPQD